MIDSSQARYVFNAIAKRSIPIAQRFAANASFEANKKLVDMTRNTGAGELPGATASDLLLLAFMWYETKEGYHFWARVVDVLKVNAASNAWRELEARLLPEMKLVDGEEEF